MQDTYGELTKSMLSLSLVLPLFGVEQLAHLLVPQDSRQLTGEAAAAFDAVTRTTTEQFDDVLRGAFQIGDQLQRDIVDLISSVLALEDSTSRRAAKTAFSMMQQLTHMCRVLLPGQENHMAWQELTNKLQAFDLFEHVDVMLNLSKEVDVPLTALVEQADALGPYRAVWATEGLGRYYTEMYWEHQGTPQELFTAERVATLPARSLIPLHTGMGLSLAERLLQTVTLESPEADIGPVLQRFVMLCRHNARAGYEGAALEALGLVTRLVYPQLMYLVDERLAQMAPDIQGYFWHGVGRGLYFLPMHALPYAHTTWCALKRACSEAPHVLGRLNTMAGLTWALTLVNIRHPEIVATILQQDDDGWSADDAFAGGVSSALMIWYDMKPDDPYLRAFCRYQPDPSDRRLAQIWHRQVQEPCQEALQQYHRVLKARRGLGEVFRYQPLADLVDRLNRPSQS